MSEVDELREYMTRNQPDRIVRKLPLKVRIYFTGLLDRLAGAESVELPSYYEEASPHDPGIDLGRAEGYITALRNEVAELAKALGLPATLAQKPVAGQKDGE